MKKIRNYLVLILMCLFLIPLSVNAGGGGDDQDINAVHKEYTNDAYGGYTSSECSRYDDCIWSKTLNAGITKRSSYECHYWNDVGGIQRMVTLHFNANGLVKLEYQTNEPRSVNEQFKAFTNEKPYPLYNEESDTGLGYYYCPNEVYHDPNASKYEDLDDGTHIRWQAFVTEINDNIWEDHVFELLAEDNFKNVMMVTKFPEADNKEEVEEDPVLEPKVCTYTKNASGYDMTIEITYISKTEVSIDYSGMFASGFNFYVDTSYIKNSDYFKNWECAPDHKVYVEIKAEENTVIVSYDADDIEGGHEFTEPGSDDDSEYDEGNKVSRCEVIPEDIRKWIVNILKFVRYVALALVVALGSLDFMKAAGSGEADAMKKAGQTFIKRLIAVAILFLLPVIVDLILNMVNLYGVDPNNVDCL